MLKIAEESGMASTEGRELRSWELGRRLSRVSWRAEMRSVVDLKTSKSTSAG